MADTPFVSQLRGYVDSVNAAKGLDWKEMFRLADSIDSQALENFLYANKGLDRTEARKYAQALKTMRRAETYRPGQGNTQSREDFENTLKKDFERFTGGEPLTPVEQAQQPQGPSPEEEETARINKYIDDLVQQLRQPVVDPVTGESKDSIYDTLLKGGATAGMSSATMRGVGGPLAGANAVDTANAAALPYLQQRQGLLASALNMQSNRNQGLEQLRQGAAGVQLQQQQFNNNVATNQWAADQNKTQGILGTIGAVGGGIAGGLLGGPMGIVSGAQAGSGLLAGAGSAFAPGPSVSPVKPYTMFNGTMGVR